MSSSTAAKMNILGNIDKKTSLNNGLRMDSFNHQRLLNFTTKDVEVFLLCLVKVLLGLLKLPFLSIFEIFKKLLFNYNFNKTQIKHFAKVLLKIVLISKLYFIT